MSDIMRPMSFSQLLDWILTEHKKSGTVFGEHHPYRADEKYVRTGRYKHEAAAIGAGIRFVEEYFDRLS